MFKVAESILNEGFGSGRHFTMGNQNGLESWWRYIVSIRLSRRRVGGVSILLFLWPLPFFSHKKWSGAQVSLIYPWNKLPAKYSQGTKTRVIP